MCGGMGQTSAGFIYQSGTPFCFHSFLIEDDSLRGVSRMDVVQVGPKLVFLGRFKM